MERFRATLDAAVRDGAGAEARLLSTLAELRRVILRHGPSGQAQIMEDADLFRRHLCSAEGALHHTSGKVVEAGFRTLCALAKTGKQATLTILRTDGVLDKMLECLEASAVHCGGPSAPCTTCSNSPVSPTLEGILDMEGLGPGVFSANPCPVSAPACGALWALCSMCTQAPATKSWLVRHPRIVHSVVAHLAHFNDEAVSASAWLLCKIVMNNPDVASALFPGDPPGAPGPCASHHAPCTPPRPAVVSEPTVGAPTTRSRRNRLKRDRDEADEGAAAENPVDADGGSRKPTSVGGPSACTSSTPVVAATSAESGASRSEAEIAGHDHLWVGRALVRALAFGPRSARCHIVWAIKGLVAESTTRQHLMWNVGADGDGGGAVPTDGADSSSEKRLLPPPQSCASILANMLCDPTTETMTRVAVVWTLGTLVLQELDLQRQLCAMGNGRVLETIVQCIGSEDGELAEYAARALHDVCVRCPEACTLAEKAGAFPLLVNLLPVKKGSAKTAEKVLGTLVALIVKHTENKLALAAVPTFVPRLLSLLACSVPGIVELAAGLARVLAEEVTICTQFLAGGVAAKLVELLQAKTMPSREHAAAALAHIAYRGPANCQSLLALNPERPLADLIINVSKSTTAVHIAASTALSFLVAADIEGRNAQEYRESVASIAGLIPALARCAHPTGCCRAGRRPSAELLAMLDPVTSAGLEQWFPVALLHDVVRMEGHFADCAICLGGDAPGGSVYLPCFHRFHVSCIKPWLCTNGGCPTCKLPVAAAYAPLPV